MVREKIISTCRSNFLKLFYF